MNCLDNPSFPPGQTTQEESVPSARGETILLVDDEDIVREIGRELLQYLGYRVLEAASGAHAIQIWRQNPGKIDLLITDLIMPGRMSGRELVAKLQSETPALKFIYTSGYTPDPDRADDEPTENFLQKPYSLHSLAQTIREKLDIPAIPASPLPSINVPILP